MVDIFSIFLQEQEIYHYIFQYQPIGIVGREFTNGPGDRGSIPDCVIPKTEKMLLDTSLLNTRHCKG